MNVSYYTMHRQGKFTTTGAPNQCKSPDWTDFHYQLALVFAGDHKLDNLDQLVDHAIVDEAVRKAGPVGSCERMHKTIAEAVAQLCNSKLLPLLLCKCVILPDPSNQTAVLTHVIARDAGLLSLLPLVNMTPMPIPAEQAKPAAAWPFAPGTTANQTPAQTDTASERAPAGGYPKVGEREPRVDAQFKLGKVYWDRRGKLNLVKEIIPAERLATMDAKHRVFYAGTQAAEVWLLGPEGTPNVQNGWRRLSDGKHHYGGSTDDALVPGAVAQPGPAPAVKPMYEVGKRYNTTRNGPALVTKVNSDGKINGYLESTATKLRTWMPNGSHKLRKPGMDLVPGAIVPGHAAQAAPTAPVRPLNPITPRSNGCH